MAGHKRCYISIEPHGKTQIRGLLGKENIRLICERSHRMICGEPVDNILHNNVIQNYDHDYYGKHGLSKKRFLYTLGHTRVEQ